MSLNGNPLVSLCMETASADGGVVGGVDDPDPYLATSGPLLMQRILSRGETYALTLTKKIGIVSIIVLQIFSLNYSVNLGTYSGSCSSSSVRKK